MFALFVHIVSPKDDLTTLEVYMYAFVGDWHKNLPVGTDDIYTLHLVGAITHSRTCVDFA